VSINTVSINTVSTNPQPPVTSPPEQPRMSRASIERRLNDITAELRTHRDELQVLDEQLQHLADEADDARLRSLVSETPLAVSEHREAARAVEALQRDREARLKKMAKLESKQDALLDQLAEVRS
jgi:chromosome segregation ATPase